MAEAPKPASRSDEELKAAVESALVFLDEFSGAGNKHAGSTARRLRAAMKAAALSEQTERREENHSHHGEGASILSRRDLFIAECIGKWIETVRKFGGFGYGKEWVPHGADLVKSRLFWRLRAGLEPLPHPPPTCYSCPWYEVVEELTPHWTMECWISTDGGKARAIIGQDGYDIEKMDAAGLPEIVTYGPWRFRVWKGKHPKNDASEGWYIQRIDEPVSNERSGQ